MSFGPGSYSDLKTRFTLIVMPEQNDAPDPDPIEEMFDSMIEEIDSQLYYYDSAHLEHCVMHLKSALAMYQFFKNEDFIEYED